MDKTCVDCFKIVCKSCSWVPDAVQFKEMQAGTLTSCPTCGWKPGDKLTILASKQPLQPVVFKVKCG